MGLDIGDKRIGMALSDPVEILASPLMVVNRMSEEADLKAIIGIIDRNQVGRVIAGLPLSMDGSVGEQAVKTKAFVQALRNRTEVSVEFRDERLSTVSAKRLMREVGKVDKAKQDTMAAAIILQSYLDEIHSDGSPLYNQP